MREGSYSTGFLRGWNGRIHSSIGREGGKEGQRKAMAVGEEQAEEDSPDGGYLLVQFLSESH